MTEKFLIIGAGQAGQSLAAALRQHAPSADITLIGDETAPPYQRPPLSKAYLLGDMPLERLYLRPLSWYEDNRITLRLGTPVSRIDRAAKTVQIGDEILPYDKLALTTGSVARRLPGSLGGDLDGVYTVRRLADIDRIEPEFREGRRLLVVGGGYIGLEAAAVAAKRGLVVKVLEAAPRILGRVAAAETAAYFRDTHAAHGVEILEGVALSLLKGDPSGRVIGAELSNGEFLEADFVITGVGIAPATALAEAAGLALSNGIAVDDHCRTSDPHIYASGDCASFPFRGERLRLESVGNAIDMAECAAANMAGEAKVYHPKPWFWSDQYDVKLQIAGLGQGHTQVVTRRSDSGLSHWYFAQDQLIAVDAMNDPRAYMVGKRLIEAGRTVDPALIADPTSDLRQLIKG